MNADVSNVKTLKVLLSYSAVAFNRRQEPHEIAGVRIT